MIGVSPYNPSESLDHVLICIYLSIVCGLCSTSMEESVNNESNNGF